MQEPAPKGIIHLVDEDAPELHKNVATETTKAGHPATSQSVNPDDQSPLEEIRDRLGGIARVAGGTVEENFSGADNRTHVVTSKGKLPILIAFKRRFLKRAA
mgnify:CR=1 FL=1